MVDLDADIVNVDDMNEFRRFVTFHLYRQQGSQRWRRPLGPYGLDTGRLPVEWHITLLRSLWTTLPT